MTAPHLAGTYPLGKLTVHRLGYGAMQLAGPNAFGPPKDRKAAIAVLREAVEQGTTTSTPATLTVRTSPTKSFVKPCVPIARASPPVLAADDQAQAGPGLVDGRLPA